jgi:hypothetical protein
MAVPNRYDIIERLNEVHSLVETSQVRNAAKTLLQFAKDFDSDRTYLHEIRLISADATEYEDEKRRSIRTHEDLLAWKRRLLYQILTYGDDIVGLQRQSA